MRKFLTLLLLISPVLASGQSGVGGGGQSNVGGGGSGGPILPSQLPAGVVKANTISATDYGVLADTHWSTHATFTNTSGAVSITASDVPFVAGDVGKICFGTNMNPTITGYSALSLKIAQGTISTVTDATHATCSTTANASCAAICTFVWGHDDATGLAAAWAAATGTGNCKTLILPTGGILTSTGQFNSSSCNTKIPVTGDSPIQVFGQGMRITVLIPTPNFVFSQSTSCNGLLNTCFFGVDGISWRDLSINGMGNDQTSATAGTGIAYIGCDGYAANVELYAFGASDTNLTGFKTSGCGTISYNINNNNAGSVGINFASGGHITASSYFCCSLTNEAVLSSSSGLTDYGSSFQNSGCGGPIMVMSSSSNHFFYRTVLSGQCNAGTTDSLTMAGSALSWFGGGVSGPSGNTKGVFMDGTSTLKAQNIIFGAAGTGFGLVTSTGSKFYDLGGNTFSGGQGAGILPGTQFGSLSISGTNLIATNVTASTAWGTSGAAGNGISAPSGDSHNFVFTVTAAGTPTANPTLAVTFPTAFWNASPPFSCTAKQIGGTGALQQLTTTTGPSVTGVTFTWIGTPAAGSTYIIAGQCNL